jgi:hypothetical protein
VIYQCNATMYVSENGTGPCAMPANWYHRAVPYRFACDACREGMIKGIGDDYLPIALRPTLPISGDK